MGTGLGGIIGRRHGRPNRADPKKGGFGEGHEKGGMRRKGREGEEKSVGGDKWGGGGGGGMRGDWERGGMRERGIFLLDCGTAPLGMSLVRVLFGCP